MPDLSPNKIAASIEALPQAEKLVMSLVYFENLSLADAAASIGISESEAKELHDRALLRMGR